MTTLAGKGFGWGDVVTDGKLPEKLHPLADPFVEVERRELGRLLNDELLLLPEKYRSPVVLCYLEGRTHEEAARQLGYPAGSMSRRLKRAHALLRRRLIHRGISLAIGLFCFIFAVLGAWNIYHRNQASLLRSAMTSLEPLTNGETELQSLVARIDRRESSRECDQIMALTRRAIQVAGEIEHHEPGKLQDDWRKYSVEMRVSAVLLAQATRENDPSSMLSAARRLNATCLGCHEVFR
jgi:RNA polymerase sigma-70 factor (ECF subfamily)